MKQEPFMSISTQRSAGFTLVEILVALAVFAVMALGLSGLAGAAMQVNGNNQTRATAASLVGSYAEGLNAGMVNKAAFSAVLAPLASARTVTLGKYSYTTQAISAQDRSGADLFATATASWVCPLSVLFRVTWQDSQGHSAPPLISSATYTTVDC